MEYDEQSKIFLMLLPYLKQILSIPIKIGDDTCSYLLCDFLIICFIDFICVHFSPVIYSFEYYHIKLEGHYHSLYKTSCEISLFLLFHIVTTTAGRPGTRLRYETGPTLT